MRRLFWVGVGAVVSVVVVERVRRAARQYTPAAVSGHLGNLGHRTTSVLLDARTRFDTARAAREQELVTALLVTPTGGDADAVLRRGPAAADLAPGAQDSRSRPAPVARVDRDEPLYDF